MTHKLIVLRHGESQWNHENKFCGWIDIPLSTKGENEARHAGELILQTGVKPDIMYTLMLQRSIKTGELILETIHRMWIPHIKTWRLNERHYGLFQGRDKNEVYEQYGKEKFQYYRRNFHAVPPQLDVDTDESIDERYADLSRDEIPTGESLELTMKRIIPFVESQMVEVNMVQENKTVLIVTHGSIVRSLIKHFVNVSDDEISKVNAPTGVPLVFELDETGKLAKDYYYLDEGLAQKGMAKVAMEGQLKL